MNAIRFAKSIFWGSEGSYNLFGIQVDFLKKNSDSDISRVSRIFQAMTFSRWQTLVHELGHAMALKLYKDNPKIEISTDRREGFTYFANSLTSIQKSVTLLAGPVAGFAFPIAQAGVGSFMPFPIRALLYGGAAFNWCEEIASFLHETSDINRVAANSKEHFQYAILLLSSLSYYCGSAIGWKNLGATAFLYYFIPKLKHFIQK